jgi:hypothetical protein
MKPKNTFAMETSARGLIGRKVDVGSDAKQTNYWKVEPRGKKKRTDRCEWRENAISKELNRDTHCKVLRGEVVSRQCKPKLTVL